MPSLLRSLLSIIVGYAAAAAERSRSGRSHQTDRRPAGKRTAASVAAVFAAAMAQARVLPRRESTPRRALLALTCDRPGPSPTALTSERDRLARQVNDVQHAQLRDDATG